MCSPILRRWKCFGGLGLTSFDHERSEHVWQTVGIAPIVKKWGKLGCMVMPYNQPILLQKQSSSSIQEDTVCTESQWTNNQYCEKRGHQWRTEWRRHSEAVGTGWQDRCYILSSLQVILYMVQPKFQCYHKNLFFNMLLGIIFHNILSCTCYLYKQF